MLFSRHIRSAQASAHTIRHELGLRRSADPPSGKGISARLRHRQQPVDATDDLIEKCPVIVLHSQHHLTGMTGDPAGHGESPAREVKCASVWYNLHKPCPLMVALHPMGETLIWLISLYW